MSRCSRSRTVWDGRSGPGSVGNGCSGSGHVRIERRGSMTVGDSRIVRALGGNRTRPMWNGCSGSRAIRDRRSRSGTVGNGCGGSGTVGDRCGGSGTTRDGWIGSVLNRDRAKGISGSVSPVCWDKKEKNTLSNRHTPSNRDYIPG